MDRVTATVAVAIGSNLGDRASHMRFAFDRLRALLGNVRISPIHETEPVGSIVPQCRFLNAVAIGETERSANDLLAELQAIERGRGRDRPFPNAPRTLDLDLILFGDAILDRPGLTVPHPRFRERRFVLEPLAEVAPEMRDPVTGKTVRELLSLIGSA